MIGLAPDKFCFDWSSQDRITDFAMTMSGRTNLNKSNIMQKARMDNTGILQAIQYQYNTRPLVSPYNAIPIPMLYQKCQNNKHQFFILNPLIIVFNLISRF